MLASEEKIMSAKSAAAALIEFDVDAAALLSAAGEYLDRDGAIALGKALRGTWTLSLAAAAAGVSDAVHEALHAQGLEAYLFGGEWYVAQIQ